MHNSFIELAYAKIKQHQDTIFTVLTCLVIVCGTIWLAQDKKAGHLEVQSASVIERIYESATHGSILVPVGSDGTMITIDASTPSEYTIKLALKDKGIEFINVEKSLFKTLHEGQSVNFDRWIGRSGIIYWKDIEPIASPTSKPSDSLGNNPIDDRKKRC
jgi:hypothetical protein